MICGLYVDYGRGGIWRFVVCTSTGLYVKHSLARDVGVADLWLIMYCPDNGCDLRFIDSVCILCFNDGGHRQWHSLVTFIVGGHCTCVVTVVTVVTVTSGGYF